MPSRTTRRSLRRWHVVHSWSSIVCTLFLLILCVTGLPLVFADELQDWGQAERPAPAAGTAAPTIDALVARARALHPGYIAGSMYIDDDEPHVTVYVKPRDDAPPAAIRPVTLDTRDGGLISDQATGQGLLAKIADLHEGLLIGLPGTLLLCLIGLLFVAALASGVMLYRPFARGRPFGNIRGDQSRRLRWLDLHNVLGIVLLGWMTVVGVTGVINTLSRPLFGVWALSVSGELKRLDTGDIAPEHLASVDGVVRTVDKALPTMRVQSIVFPSRSFGTPHHFVVWTVGRTHLTSRLFTVALVDGETGRLTTVRTLPWYLRLLEVSRPLHFGDYGGMPLKILWALFDLVAIVVLASGLYLWFARRRWRGRDAEPFSSGTELVAE